MYFFLIIASKEFFLPAAYVAGAVFWVAEENKSYEYCMYVCLWLENEV